MIYPRYRSFRHGFALVGASTADDGMPEWPLAKLRSGGFTNLPGSPVEAALCIDTPITRQLLSIHDGFASLLSPPLVFPLLITCNDVVEDLVPGTHDYDYYISQRVDDVVWDPNAPLDVDSILDEPAHRRAADQYFTFSFLTGINGAKSGSIYIDAVTPNVTRLIPSFTYPTLPTDTADLATLFKNVHIYVQRRSDKAYQWARLYA